MSIPTQRSYSHHSVTIKPSLQTVTVALVMRKECLVGVCSSVWRKDAERTVRKNEWESGNGMHRSEGVRRNKESIKDKGGSREERKETGNFVSSLDRGWKKVNWKGNLRIR